MNSAVACFERSQHAPPSFADKLDDISRTDERRYPLWVAPSRFFLQPSKSLVDFLWIAKETLLHSNPATGVTCVFYFCDLGLANMPWIRGGNPAIVTRISPLYLFGVTQVPLLCCHLSTGLARIHVFSHSNHLLLLAPGSLIIDILYRNTPILAISRVV